MRTHVVLALLMLGTRTVGADEPPPAEVKACDKGKGQACLDLGIRYVNGKGVDKDADKALSFYLKACKLKVALGCGYAGTMSIKAQDNEKGRELLEKACTLNDGASCNDLGTGWAEGTKGVPEKDLAKAKSYYEKACKLNDGLGCFNIGNAYRLGEAVQVDLKEALTHFQRACDLGAAKGCTEAAIVYYEGKVVPKDAARAITLLEKGCKLGSEVACKNLNILRPKSP